MAINKITFVITTSWNKHLGTAELICDKMTKTIMTSIRQVVRVYKAQGFQVTTILGNKGF